MMYNTDMNVATFDTYRFIKRLKDAGIPEEHAAAEADALSEALHVNLDKLATKADIKGMATKADIEGLRTATKADIEGLRTATKADIEGLRTATKADIEGLRTATRSDIKTAIAESEAKMMKFLFAIFLAQAALIVSLIKLI